MKKKSSKDIVFSPEQNNTNEIRRKVLFTGLLGGGATLLQAQLLSGAAGLLFPRSLQAAVPAYEVKLSDFGGVPNASSSVIISAFNQAFARLKSLGGGTLTIAPGVYNLGTHSNVSVISVSDLQNVIISGYGAQLVMTTGSTSTSATNNTPVFLHFQNPNNVTVAGLAFKDLGSDILFRNTGGRWGAICLNVYASVARSGFKTVDCVADAVVTFVRSDNRNAPYMFTGFDIHGTVRNSYYGVQMLRNGRYSKANITALNVRRAFLSQSCRDFVVNVTTHRTEGIGSNAHVVLDAFPSWPVQDCTVNIKASGALNGYVCLGSICHQGPDGSYSVARNVKFNIAIENATSAATTGFISLTAEPENALPYAGIRPSTVSAFENIQITGTVSGPYGGKIVANPSVSSATTNSVYVASNLAALQNMSLLPSYFHVVPVTTPEPEPQPEPTPVLLSLSSFQASSDTTNAYYKYNFTGQVSYHRLFLDTDSNLYSGYRKNGIGANYLIENGALYRYSGTNGAWGWTRIKTVSVTATATSMSLSIARVDLGSPSALKVFSEVDDQKTSVVSAVVSQTLAPIGVTLSNAQVTSDYRNLYCKYNFTGQVNYHRIFIDTDGNSYSGYRKDGTGANYLIENGSLYRYSGSNGAWGWTRIKTVTVTATSTSRALTILRSDLGSPRSVKVIVELAGSTNTVKSSVLLRTL